MWSLMAVSIQPLAHRAGAACCSPPGSSFLQKDSVNHLPLCLEDVPGALCVFLSKTGKFLP